MYVSIITLPTGAILVVLILALGPISGAHFNPVVSVVMAFTGALPRREVIPYLIFQVAGGCIGTIIAHAMFDLPLIEFGAKARTGLGQWLAEFIATFGLLVTILTVARFKRKRSLMQSDFILQRPIGLPR